jgi:hypothetical protein
MININHWGNKYIEKCGQDRIKTRLTENLVDSTYMTMYMITKTSVTSKTIVNLFLLGD